MCGICGIFDAQGGAARLGQLVRRMAGTLEHRGPDDEGFYVTERCALGHRRLKIIDLSPLGRQPMSNEDESLWVSFNGEIYNYLELRSELLRRGHKFRSQTDTEVLVHLYEEEGEDFLRRLNGMFALALWDQRRQRLLLARDRFGKKPVYYYTDGGRLLFASELKGILADPAVPRRLDFSALSYYLALGYIPCPLTIFSGISKLPPASFLVIDLGPDLNRLRLSGPEKYWRLSYKPDPSLTEQECVERVREIIREAVRIRLCSDVPLGAFLSGGVDSSTVVAAMAGANGKPVETFSVGFDEASFDEVRYAEQVARRFHTNHHTFRCTPDALEVLPTLARHYDEPFADSSAVPTYYVSKLARQYVTVALSGDGGDEIFAGYTRYDQAIASEKLRKAAGETVWRSAFSLLAEIFPRKVRGWGILYRNSLDAVGAFAASMSLFQPVEKESLWSEETKEILRDQLEKGDAKCLFEAWANQTSGSLKQRPDLLSVVQFIDQMSYLPDDILVKVDRASMAVSLEARAPLLDYRLAEFMATVPASLRYRNGVKKYLLKKAVTGVLPDEIIHRRKAGFGAPLHSWFNREAGLFARQVLTSRQFRERGIFDAGRVERMLGRHSAGRRTTASQIWALLFFELWCRHWLDQSPAPAFQHAEVMSCPAR